MKEILEALYGVIGNSVTLGALALILLLFLLGSLSVLGHLKRTLRERKLLKKARMRFEDASAEEATSKQIMESLNRLLPDCLVRRRLNLLYKIRYLHSISSDLLNRLDLLEESVQYNFVRFVGNVLIILGLLGTVIGLTLAIQGILPAIKDAEKLSDLSFITRAMAETMNGLQTAFYTTLAALAASFALSLLLVVAQKAESALLTGLESFLTFEFIPKILISSEQEASTSFVEAIKESAHHISDAAEVLDRSRHGIGQIVNGLIQATQTTENRITDFYNFAQNFDNSVNRLVGYSQKFQELHSRLEGVLKEIQKNQMTQEMVSEIIDRSVTRAMDAVAESSQEVREAFKRDIAQTVSAQKGLTEVIAQTRDAVQNFSKDSAESISRLVQKALDQSLEKFQKGLDLAAQRETVSRMVVGEAIEHFRGFVEQTQQRQQAGLQMDRQLHDQLAKTLQRFAQDGAAQVEGRRRLPLGEGQAEASEGAAKGGRNAV